MKNFTFEGLQFKPLNTLKGKQGEFFAISKRISDKGLTPEDWNYDEFYQVAKENGAGEIDLFEMNGKVVIPAENYLFEYK
ncbi:hypothetical protein EEL30_22020 [Brevibacillus laterosporus]|uniref:Uncharacterized protein n=1 Tax=Brevibacillus laterosporus TaxID=1465 RepID=A0A518VCJ1_BRELA|nr:hypothetical protein EEL30_22020 [Brevibacillus laterosporus]